MHNRRMINEMNFKNNKNNDLVISIFRYFDTKNPFFTLLLL